LAATVYVTHDQIEAMGDRIAVMSAAEVQQEGLPPMHYATHVVSPCLALPRKLIEHEHPVVHIGETPRGRAGGEARKPGLIRIIL
jgi:hypothetical protein